jgi:hypothetical protein
LIRINGIETPMVAHGETIQIGSAKFAWYEDLRDISNSPMRLTTVGIFVKIIEWPCNNKRG